MDRNARAAKLASGGCRRSLDQRAAHPRHLRADRRRRASPHERRWVEATLQARFCSATPPRLIGDKAYDSAELRCELHERGSKSVIPNKSNRKQPFSFNNRLYKLRWRIENAFNRLKDFRRIATRYDKLARNYLASICLAAALVWWI